MAIQPLPAHGALNWDIPLNSILAQLGNTWNPSDQGWLSSTMDPSESVSESQLANGEIFTIAVPLRQAATVSTITTVVVTAGVGLTAGQNFAGLYNSAGTRVGVTADQSAVWNTNGVKTMALTAPANLTAGIYYVAFLGNAATPATIGRRANALAPAILNANLTAATFRTGRGFPASTTLPASLTMTSRTSSDLMWFAALS